MGKRVTRDPKSDENRQIKRICRTIDSALREKLGLSPVQGINEPYPVPLIEALAFLHAAAAQSYGNQ